MDKSGFSLVELSIVLVILGLLTGGVLTGQSLIRAAELRSVTTEFNQYKIAVNTFKQKYFALPGDMNNAEEFWGTMPSGTCPHAAGGTGTQTCSGDGNGKIQSSGAPGNVSNERFTFWQHLANAGLIKGTYTGRAGFSGNSDHNIEENHPSSALSNGGWSIDDRGIYSGNGNFFDGVYNNTLSIGTVISAGNVAPNDPIFAPEEIWNIDKKIDDGMPAQGTLVPKNRGSGCTVASDGTTLLTSSAAHAALTDAQYNLQESSIECSLTFRDVF